MREDADKRTRAAGPPTQLMVAWSALSPRDRRRLTLAGLVLLTFTVGVPMAAAVVLAVLERPALPIVVWGFSGLFGTIAVGMIFPPLGVWAVSSAAPALAKLIPTSKLSGMLERPERRAPREE